MEHFVTTEGHRAAGPASLILFSVDCSGGSATFFPYSGARGEQWECPRVGVRPSLPSPASSIATVASNTAATATSSSVQTSSLSWGASPAGGPPLPVRGVLRVIPPALLSRVLDMGTFLCPRCRLSFRSRPLLQVHLEKLCLGPTAPSSSCLHGGNPLPVEGAQGTARKPQDISVVWCWVWCRMGTGTGAGLGNCVSHPESGLV